MLPPRLLPLFATLSTLPLTDSGRALGTLILGAPGAGKTIFESLCLLVDLLRGLPGCVLDPLGTLSEALLFRLGCFLSEFPTGDDELLWQRLRYIELGGDAITHFPIYSQRQGESLWDASQRLITVLERANPQLVTGSPLTWPAARRLAVNAGMLLTALGYQLTKVEDLLFNTLEWEKTGKFQEAINRNPQAAEAVSYFRNSYLPLPRPDKSRLSGTFLDQVFPLTAERTLRAVFSGSSSPGIDWETVEANPQIVILNFKRITNPTARSFAMQWVFENLYPHLQGRGRRSIPFVVTVDEFAHLAAAGMGENKPLADLFDEFIAQYMRNNRVFLTLAFQSIDQVDERLRQTVFRLGTIITGRAGSMREARVLADQLFRRDIYRVQHYRKVWGKVDPPPFIRGYGPAVDLTAARLTNPSYPYFVLDYEPEHMSLENQEEEAAGMIQKLGTLEFLCRPAVREGEVSQEVVPLAIADAIRDPDTGDYQFPDPDQDTALIAQRQHELAARSGIPLTDILKEQEARLTTRTPQKPPQTQTIPAEEVRSRQTATLPDGRQPVQRKPKTDPTLPALDEQQQAFLAFITEHPDTPVTVVYKKLGIGVSTGGKIRESLRQQGFLHELDIRAGSTNAGRPMKCLLPTFAALELLGIDPPKGRGGALHRHVQQLVTEGATAKGYRVTCEKAIGTGAIVDVDLEKDGKILAVEIAIASKPDREIAHIRNCLNWGYDQVYCLIADETLLQRTETGITKTFSPEEQGKVRLMPLSKYMQIG
jgi:hypothetical protein